MNRKSWIKYREMGMNTPTLRELRETIAPLTRATAWQIITGQAVYYGYEVDRDVDNDIPIHTDEQLDKAGYNWRYRKPYYYGRNSSKVISLLDDPNFRKGVKAFRKMGLSLSKAREIMMKNYPKTVGEDND